MSREETVAVIESFLNCLASKELDRLPIDPELTVESPLTSKLSGQAALEYLKVVAAGVKAIQIRQHIVEGDHVATLLEEDTLHGSLQVFAKFQLESGRIKDTRVFYDPRQIAGSARSPTEVEAARSAKTESNRWLSGEHGPCWVCAVVDGTTKAFVVSETSDVLVLVSPLPLNPGHTLVVPRRHVRDLYQLPEALAGPILATAARVARAAKRAFSADGITLRQNNDPAGGQEVFHFHLHVTPRFAGDTDRFNAPPKLIGWPEQEAVAERLRAVLGAV